MSLSLSIIDFDAHNSKVEGVYMGNCECCQSCLNFPCESCASGPCECCQTTYDSIDENSEESFGLGVWKSEIAVFDVQR